MKKTVSSSQAPEAVGAYSQAILSDDFVFLSGQIPLTPEGVMVEGGIREETERCLKNIKAILNEIDIGIENIVKVTVYLENIENFEDMNSVYSDFFGDEDPPARSAVEVGKIPKDAGIEIEAIAVLN